MAARTEAEVWLSEAEAWLAADPDPQTRAELEDLLVSDDEAGLHSRFGEALSFGTAGLRGALGAGPNRMNRVQVRQTTAGLVSVLLAGSSARSSTGELAGGPTGKSAGGTAKMSVGPARMEQGGIEGGFKGNLSGAISEPPTLAIGYDARRNSDIFAQDAAQVAVSFGANVLLIQGVVPTPVLAHLTLHRKCQAGIMITASHNPPQDNGYKVYWSDGAQIIPPWDREIEQARKQVGLLPADLSDLGAPNATPGELNTITSEQAIAQYVETVAAGIVELFAEHTAEPVAPSAPADFPKCVYTPLHGVGHQTVKQVFAALGLPAPLAVEAQAAPDGSFPTVAFPNPEEPGALDLALELAREQRADVVLANDPDADRLAVALRQTSDGQPGDGQPGDGQTNGADYRVLSGNELGVLLGDGLLSLTQDRAQDFMVGATIVSSQLLGKVARARGAGFGETLTGFKWLARLGFGQPAEMLFGYEEALGYSVLPELVRDKDGITAAAVFVLLMRHWARAGTTPLERLRDLATEHGLHLGGSVSFRYEGDSAAVTMAAIMGSLRTDPPAAIGDGKADKIVAMKDYAQRSAAAPADAAAPNAAAPDGSVPTASSSPPANVLAYFLADGTRVTLRPSGTEPKLKVYLEVSAEPPADFTGQPPSQTQFDNWQSQAQARLDSLTAATEQLIEQRSIAARDVVARDVVAQDATAQAPAAQPNPAAPAT